METKIYRVAEWEKDKQAISDIGAAASVLRNGGLVAFPTETVYGLGADALNSEAVADIYRAKGRPSDNPIIIHIADVGTLNRLAAKIPDQARTLADAFWPGPLTMVLSKKPEVPDVTTGGLPTVAVRMPDHPVALELIRQAGCPVAAPSANLSGKPSPTRAIHVEEDMKGKIPVILAGGDCRVGIESTVVDLTGREPVILRPGLITAEEIGQVLGCGVGMDSAVLSEFDTNEDGPAPKAPGMKYRHYAPKAEMIVFKGPRGRVEEEIAKRKKREEALGHSVGVILFQETAFEEAAHNFFARLRELDASGVDRILAGAMDEENGKGFAVMDRMLKSAGYHVVRVE